MEKEGFSSEHFVHHINQISEEDYGDFMRLANFYLNQFRDELKALQDQSIEGQLDKMQLYLQYAPNWDVESTRKRLLQDARYIDELLHGHEQDWESATF